MEKVKVDENSYSLQRINEKCIDCGQCLVTCQKLNQLNKEDCIHCGQCILICPMGALVPKYNYKEVLANIHDEEKIVVVSIAPAVRVAIGDEFGFSPGEFLEKKLVGVLKALGFDYVFDVTFGADLTIMEEATEFIQRLKENRVPMFTSCCPSWVLDMEKYHESDINFLSTCKSPIGMQGAVIKNYFAQKKNLNPDTIVTVTIAPCVSKKSEIRKDHNQDNDYILTTSELAMMIREVDIPFNEVEEKEFDSMLGRGSGSGVIFGSSGGVMEAVLRTSYYFLNGKDAPEDFFHLNILRGTNSFKEAEIDLGKKKIKVAVIYGIANVNQYYDHLKTYHFIEVMACPNGCVGGGGQPIIPQAKQESFIKARGDNLFLADQKDKKRASYQNEEILSLYKDYLEAPNSLKAKELLHNRVSK